MKKYKITRNQKESIALLSIGTFLEYFDLGLYIHMATLLNELFFPKSDPLAAKLLATTAFCLTFVLRPVGGIVIGRIGDILGRKSTILITTFTMSIACLIMALTGTYSDIGIAATIIIMICRILQGFSSLGEVMGASIYLSETLKSPYKYIAGGVVDIGANAGGLFALMVSSLVLSSDFTWRIAFFIGAGIALVGMIARTKLRETPEFADYNKRMKRYADTAGTNTELKFKEKIDKKSVFGLFITVFLIPACYYVTYFYLGNFAKQVLGMTPELVTKHNLKLAIYAVFGAVLVVFFVRKYSPVRIVKLSFIIFSFALILLPFCLNNISTGTSKGIYLLSFLQCLIYVPVLNNLIKINTWLKHFPVYHRFTVAATIFGLASALAFPAASFGLLFLEKLFGYYSLWVLFMPVMIGCFWAINYLKKLEIKRGCYKNYPHDDYPYPDTAKDEKKFSYNLSNEYHKFNDHCQYTVQLLDKIKIIGQYENHRKVNLKLIQKAIIFTKKWHHGQMRKDKKTPFYAHPFIVAGIVAQYYYKTDVIIAALLHDVIEDTSCTVAMIAQNFNYRIAQMVDRLTKVRVDNEKIIKMTLQQTLEQLQKLGDYESFFIKEKDRMHNLETIAVLPKEKKQQTKEETNFHFIKMLAIIRDKIGSQENNDFEKEMLHKIQNIV